MLRSIRLDTVVVDNDKLTSYPELYHVERICCFRRASLLVGLTVCQERERIRFTPTRTPTYPEVPGGKVSRVERRPRDKRSCQEYRFRTSPHFEFWEQGYHALVWLSESSSI